MTVAQSITLGSALEIPSNYCRLNEWRASSHNFRPVATHSIQCHTPLQHSSSQSAESVSDGWPFIGLFIIVVRQIYAFNIFDLLKLDDRATLDECRDTSHFFNNNNFHLTYSLERGFSMPSSPRCVLALCVFCCVCVYFNAREATGKSVSILAPSRNGKRKIYSNWICISGEQLQVADDGVAFLASWHFICATMVWGCTQCNRQAAKSSPSSTSSSFSSKKPPNSQNSSRTVVHRSYLNETS